MSPLTRSGDTNSANLLYLDTGHVLTALRTKTAKEAVTTSRNLHPIEETGLSTSNASRIETQVACRAWSELNLHVLATPLMSKTRLGKTFFGRERTV